MQRMERNSKVHFIFFIFCLKTVTAVANHSIAVQIFHFEPSWWPDRPIKWMNHPWNSATGTPKNKVADTPHWLEAAISNTVLSSLT